MATKGELIAIWEDSSFDNAQSSRDLQELFKKELPVIKKWFFVDHDDAVEDLIQQNVADTIILILPGKAAQRILGLHSQHKNIRSVFIFCGRVEAHERMKTEEPKIRAVVNHQNDLLNELKKELAIELIQ